MGLRVRTAVIITHGYEEPAEINALCRQFGEHQVQITLTTFDALVVVLVGQHATLVFQLVHNAVGLGHFSHNRANLVALFYRQVCQCLRQADTTQVISTSVRVGGVEVLEAVAGHGVTRTACGWVEQHTITIHFLPVAERLVAVQQHVGADTLFQAVQDTVHFLLRDAAVDDGLTQPLGAVTQRLLFRVGTIEVTVQERACLTLIAQQAYDDVGLLAGSVGVHLFHSYEGGINTYPVCTRHLYYIEELIQDWYIVGRQLLAQPVSPTAQGRRGQPHLLGAVQYHQLFRCQGAVRLGAVCAALASLVVRVRVLLHQRFPCVVHIEVDVASDRFFVNDTFRPCCVVVHLYANEVFVALTDLRDDTNIRIQVRGVVVAGVRA